MIRSGRSPRAAAGPVDQAIEQVVRRSYGRLVALLACRGIDLTSAEDALAEAFANALRRWPTDGVPANPEGWLLVSARRRLIDGLRHAAVRERVLPLLAVESQMRVETSPAAPFPDRRLELLFACAHPAIDPTLHTPLMLQTVLGLDAATIASAFLSAPATMAQRLVRAKRKIRDAGLRFEIPPLEAFPERLDAVLEAIYAAFGSTWESQGGLDDQGPGLAWEALTLGRLVVEALPEAPEARGLLALMLYCQARRRARFDRNGNYQPLASQDPSQWDQPLIGEAEHHLQQAGAAGCPGRFQLEAAIQSAHLAPAYGRPIDESVILRLYDGLAAMAPTVAVLVNRAAALARAKGPEVGLEAAEALPLELVGTHQPWWALKAHLLERCGRLQEAKEARQRAIGLTENPAVRAYLLAAQPRH